MTALFLLPTHHENILAFLISSRFVQAQYWHDPYNEVLYREKSQFLADINQEKVSDSHKLPIIFLHCSPIQLATCLFVYMYIYTNSR